MTGWKGYWNGAVLNSPGLSYVDVFKHLQAEGYISSEDAEKEYGIDNLDLCMEFWRKEMEYFPDAMRCRRIYRCDDGGDETKGGWYAYVLVDFME